MRNRNAIYFYATFLKIIKWTRVFPRLQGFSAPEKLQTFILLSCSNLSQWEASFLGRMKKIAISLGFTQHCLKNFVKFFILPIQLFKISFVLAKTALPHFFQNLIALPCYFFLELKHSSLARIVLWNTIWISKVLSCVLSNDEIKVRERSEEEGKKTQVSILHARNNFVMIFLASSAPCCRNPWHTGACCPPWLIFC